jgi:WD40 repeat protein
LASTPFQLDSEPVSTCFAPDGKAVAVHCMNGTAILLNPSTGGELLRVKCRATRTVEGSYPWMSGRGTIGFSHDGQTFFTWGSPVVQAWDRATGRERYAVKHNQDCWAFAESPDGRVLATGSQDGRLCLWDADNGSELRAPMDHPGHVLTVAFSPDGRLLATSCGDWQTRVWEVATGKLAYAMSPGGWLTDARFTPDGRFVVNAGASGVQLWDAKTGYAITKRIATATGAFPQLDITPDGHWALVSGSANFFHVSDIQSLTGVAKGSPEEALLWAELLSNSRINGSTIVNLSNSEWLERWRAYRLQHPEFRPLEERASP